MIEISGMTKTILTIIILCIILVSFILSILAYTKKTLYVDTGSTKGLDGNEIEVRDWLKSEGGNNFMSSYLTPGPNYPVGEPVIMNQWYYCQTVTSAEYPTHNQTGKTISGFMKFTSPGSSGNNRPTKFRVYPHNLCPTYPSPNCQGNQNTKSYMIDFEWVRCDLKDGGDPYKHPTQKGLIVLKYVDEARTYQDKQIPRYGANMLYTFGYQMQDGEHAQAFYWGRVNLYQPKAANELICPQSVNKDDDIVNL